MTRTCMTIFVLLICFVVPMQAQSGRQPGSAPINAPTPQTKNKRGEEVVVIDSDLVVLDARVVSRQTGRFVGGLKKDDFEVYEDGKRQEITHFSEDTPPLSVVFLIDMTGPATHGVLKKISTNIEQILQHLRSEDEAAIMLVAGDHPGKGQVFSDIWLLHPFTKDKALLAKKSPASMWEYRVPDVPPTFNDVPTKHQAIYEAALLLEKAPATNRRVIVPSNRKRDKKFRKITLRVSEAAASREGGVTVATKAGYYLPANDNKETTDRKK